jgi:hypothetical protein
MGPVFDLIVLAHGGILLFWNSLVVTSRSRRVDRCPFEAYFDEASSRYQYSCLARHSIWDTLAMLSLFKTGCHAMCTTSNKVGSTSLKADNIR